MSGYPQPRRTATNAPMLDAWQGGALLLQRCRDCAHVFFYPRSACPRCWSGALNWVRAGGQGRVVSYSIVHRGLHDSFVAEAPIVLAEIVLAEGALMIARVVGDGRLSIAAEAPVRLVAPEAAARYPLPTFMLEQG